MKFKRILSLLLCVLLLCTLVQTAFAAVIEDERPETVPAGTSADLIDIELTGFKGSRIEFIEIPLEEPIVPGKYDYEMHVDMKNMWASDPAIYVKPVAYDENATFVINGEPCDFNTPYRMELGTVKKGEAPKEMPCEIVVTSADRKTTATYTLTFINQDMLDEVKVTTIEETMGDDGKLLSGVYQFTSINGFTSSEDCAIFIGRDRALLFDALNGGTDGKRRGGDLKEEIYTILRTKFGVENPDDFPIDVAITHNNGDHYGMINSSTPEEYRLDGRGSGKGTIYWMIGNPNNSLLETWSENDTDVKMLAPGDILIGPDFGNGPLEFEVYLAFSVPQGGA